jgi:hypothetical protein
MALIDQLAEELSADVMAAMEELGDDRFHEEVSKVLLAASPTVQEAFMTAMRFRLAAKRGRVYMEKALASKRAAQKT